MSQNQSHKRAEISIFLKMSKSIIFFVFVKNKIFVQVSVTQIDFHTFLLEFLCIFRKVFRKIFKELHFIFDETQFFLFKGSFLIILDFKICGFTNLRHDTDLWFSPIQSTGCCLKLVYLLHMKKLQHATDFVP